MRLIRALALAGSISVLTGCGYVHFGRLPKFQASDAALQQAYSDLSVEHKILKQELVLARKETDSLRSALDRGGSTSSTAGTALTRQLEETAKELATVRADYAKLRAERSSAAVAATTAATTDTTTLRDENVRLRRELAAARQENADLAEQLKASVARAEQAQSSATQLNAELLQQKDARERAEQAAMALRTQLEAVMARANRSDEVRKAESAGASAPTLGPGPSPSALSALQGAKAPPSGAVPVVEIRTSMERIRAVAAANAIAAATSPKEAASPAPQAAPAPTPGRTYVVQAGDTLEKIAVKLYGAADQWSKLYAANADALAANQGIKAGMTLQVPE